MAGKRNKGWLIVAAGTVAVLLFTGGLFLGAQSGSTSQSKFPGIDLPFPETLLNATATNSAENFAIATGKIDDYGEGLFMLDALTGDLQCVVINSRTAKFTSFYKANVLQDMQIQGKKPKFLLVTGYMNFRTGGTSRPAQSVVYVVDANTGRYAAYGVPLMGQSKKAAAIGKLLLLDARDARSSEVNE